MDKTTLCRKGGLQFASVIVLTYTIANRETFCNVMNIEYFHIFTSHLEKERRYKI